MELYNACGEGNIKKVRSLLRRRNIDIDYYDDTICGTPLYYACRMGHINIAKLLIKKGADINKPNNKGYTPLSVACVTNNYELGKLLLESGVDINQPDYIGLLPLTKNSNEQLERLLRKHGGVSNMF